jgi:phage baseplate assembly protein W
MFVVNNVPSNNDSKLVKTLAFPFQKGSSGFPAMADPQNRVYTRILELLSTSPWERVLDNKMGVNVYKYVFSTMTAIQQARLSSEISNAIQEYIPGVFVNIVDVSKLEEVDSSKNGFVFTVSYTVNGQSEKQQVIYTPSATGGI